MNVNNSESAPALILHFLGKLNCNIGDLIEGTHFWFDKCRNIHNVPDIRKRRARNNSEEE